jgi:hypothetical protein
MPDPTTYAGFAAGTWPENAPTAVNQNTMRNFIGPTARFLMNLPQVATPYAGQPLMARADGAGFTYAGLSGAAAIDCGGLPIRNSPPDRSVITSSLTLRHNIHNGGFLICDSSSSITLNVALDSSGVLGIRDGFFAEILHAGSGALQLSLGLSGVANQRPDQKLGVAPGLAVTVLLHGVRLFILGAAV